jgi:hypothetical protein
VREEERGGWWFGDGVCAQKLFAGRADRDERDYAHATSDKDRKSWTCRLGAENVVSLESEKLVYHADGQQAAEPQMVVRTPCSSRQQAKPTCAQRDRDMQANACTGLSPLCVVTPTVPSGRCAAPSCYILDPQEPHLVSPSATWRDEHPAVQDHCMPVVVWSDPRCLVFLPTGAGRTHATLNHGPGSLPSPVRVCRRTAFG